MLVEERQHPFIEQIRRGDRRLAIVQLGAGDLPDAALNGFAVVFD